MNLLILYFIVSWLPALLRQSSMPVSAGVTAVTLFSLGGVAGTLSQGKAMNAWGAHATLLTEFALSAALVAALSFFTTSFALTMGTTLVLGVFVQGAQAGINALSASFYPTAIRATGVGWALGVGRMGSIVGPVIGGLLLSLGWHAQQILLAGAIPAVCATAAIALSVPRSHAAGSAWSAQ
jgi:AAHS family 4-hydroxybenzoate transporter-like MFS transporter